MICSLTPLRSRPLDPLVQPRRWGTALLGAGAALCLTAAAPMMEVRAQGAAPVREISDRLAQRWKTPILVDPAIAFQVPTGEPDGRLALEAALGALTGSLKDTVWKRLELPPKKGEALPPATRLAALARALPRLRTGSLVVEDPRSRQVTVFLKDVPAAQWSAAPRDARPFGEEPAYLVYSAAAEEPAEDRLADLERQQLSLALPDGHKGLAMAQIGEMIRVETPARVEEAFTSMYHAGMRLWEQTDKTDRDDMIHQGIRLLSQFGAPPAGPMPAPAKGAVPQRAAIPGSELRELKARLATLAARRNATVLVDPGIVLSVLPERFPRGATVDEALERVTAAATGTAWRRVYLARPDPNKLPPTDQIAAAVRAVDRMETAAAFHDPGSKRVTACWQRRGAGSMPAEVEQWRLNEKPVYLLYSTIPSARGGSSLEQLADLQRQQIALMLRLNPDQLTGSLTRLLDGYRSDPAARERILGLPMMAGLLGVWCPRQAKEEGR